MKTATILTVVLMVVTFVLVVAPVAFGQPYNPHDWEVRNGYGYGGHYGNGNRGQHGNDWSRVAVEAIRVAGAIIEQPRYVQQPMYVPQMGPGQQYQQQQYQYPQQYPPQSVASQVPLHVAIYGYGQKRPVTAPQSAPVTVVNNNVNRNVVVLQGQPPYSATPAAAAPVAPTSASAPAMPADAPVAPKAIPAPAPATPAVAPATPPVPAPAAPIVAPAAPAAIVAPAAEPSYFSMFGFLIGAFFLMLVGLLVLGLVAYFIVSRLRSQATPVVAPSSPVRPRAPTPVAVAPATPPAPALAPTPAPAPVAAPPAVAVGGP